MKLIKAYIPTTLATIASSALVRGHLNDWLTHSLVNSSRS
jgi:hypothetical protein